MYAQRVVRFTQSLVNDIVLWSKLLLYGQLQQTEDIKQLLQDERDARQRHDQQAQAETRAKKCYMIYQAKRKCFREAIHEATQGEGIQRLAKWGRTSNGPPVLLVMPDLRSRTRLVTTILDKVTALYTRFYLLVEADLTNIYNITFTDKTCQDILLLDQCVTSNEIQALLCTRKTNKAPGSDSISNDFLKAMGKLLTIVVVALALVCQNLGHYPAEFKYARIIVIQKPGKESYKEPGAQRLIALLNTISKLIEAVTAKRIQEAAKQNNLLLDTQIGAYIKRSTKTALELLTKQVQTVQKSPKHMATMLALNLSGAFDTVHPVQLLDIFYKKRMLGQLI